MDYACEIKWHDNEPQFMRNAFKEGYQLYIRKKDSKIVYELEDQFILSDSRVGAVIIELIKQ